MENIERGAHARVGRLQFGAVVGTLVVSVLASAPPARPANPILIGKVGGARAHHHNAYVISLRFPDGTAVTSIPAGTYTFVIHDYSRIHNFALGSQTANKRLFTGGIRSTGTKSYVLTLTPGSYAYACSAHFQTMNGSFIVTG
jgi:plastocyanin